jgi:hypothetical protein
MGTINYRESRNLEKTLIDFITNELTSANPPWSDFTVEKAWSKITDSNIPVILVQMIPTDHIKLECGSSLTRKVYTVFVRIFAEDDGQRLDMKDWLCDILEPGIDYYRYTITSNQILKECTGRVNITIITDRKELENIEGAAVKDRYRHLISLKISISEV